MSRLRFSEYVPAPPNSDAVLLRGLPSAWERAVAESDVDALKKRAEALASLLAERGRHVAAADLRRRLAYLERADELHVHAASVEILAHLYRALSPFAHEQERPMDGSPLWLQAGALRTQPASGHGPAFRETAVLRNRAYRWVEQAVAQYARVPCRAARPSLS